MHNIWHIFRRDVSSLFRNVMCTIITVGLVLLPSLFAWYNILACWNVFDNTGNLSVAVANEDEGYTSNLIPLEVNVGEKVISALRANKQINWVFTNSDDAVEGAHSGKYYAALVIPDSFSSQMLTFYKNDSASADILYYVNEKKNAISPNITGAGADTLSYQINAAFAGTVSEIAAVLAKSFTNYADDQNLSSTIGDLTDHMRIVSRRLDQTADVLGLYSPLGTEAANMLGNTANTVEAARTKAENALSGASEQKEDIRTLAANLGLAIDSLSGSLDGAKTTLTDLQSTADSLLANATANAVDAAAQLRDRAAGINDRANALVQQRDTLASLRDELHAGAVRERDNTISPGGSTIDISTSVQVTTQNTAVLDEAIAVLDKAIGSLQTTSNGLTNAADKLEAAGPNAQQDIDALRQTIAQVSADLDATSARFNQTLAPSIETLRTNLETLATDFETIATNFDELGSDLVDTTSGLEGSLVQLSGKINSATDNLHSSAQDITTLADNIDTALASGNIETLRALLTNNADSIATALSAPIQVKREVLFPVDNFGSAMTPLYCTLALFIGALLIMVATKPEVSPRAREELADQLRNPKPRHFYLGRFGVVGLLSLLQTTLLGFGSMLFLKVQVTEPVLFMACFWIAGLVFAFIIYTLVVSFGNLGKAIAVLLLIVQVTGCGGSYPLPIMPDFVQALSPWVPASHVVNALRAAMFGVYQNDFWISIGKLALFIVPFLLLGLALRKPLEGFMKSYISKVEQSKIVE